MNKNLLVVMFCLLIACAAVQSKKAQADDDEFSEFDTVEEENEMPQSKSHMSHQAQNNKQNDGQVDDDEFAEFDDNDENEKKNVRNTAEQSSKPAATSQKQQQKDTKSKQNEQQKANVKMPADLDSEEFEHFVDDEEFEEFDTVKKDDLKSNDKQKQGQQQQQQQQKTKQSAADSAIPSLKIADVPKHLMTTNNWTNYIYEICMLVVILIYSINYIYGKTKNYSLVNAWYQAHRQLLHKNFALVGDDGSSTELPSSSDSANSTGVFIKDSDNSYAMWCSGRQTCDGVLMQLKLIKRQDLINGVVMQLLKPKSDQLIISVEYQTPDVLDNFVFCLANKKLSQQLMNDYQDLSSYCVEKKLLSSNSSFSLDHKYSEMLKDSVASKYVLINELGEVPNAVLDPSFCGFMNTNSDMIEYVLISDQYVGLKSLTSEENPSPVTNDPAATSTIGLPKSRPILIICFNIPGNGLNTSVESMEQMQSAFLLAMHLIDKVPRIRLSKEAKAKSIKKRKEISEQFMKLTHKQRQEAAMLRKEEKRRAEKEKIMNESDPEKQKRLEEKELKREKRKNMKAKQIKIKSF